MLHVLNESPHHLLLAAVICACDRALIGPGMLGFVWGLEEGVT